MQHARCGYCIAFSTEHWSAGHPHAARQLLPRRWGIDCSELSIASITPAIFDAAGIVDEAGILAKFAALRQLAQLDPVMVEPREYQDEALAPPFKHSHRCVHRVAGAPCVPALRCPRSH